VGAAWGVPMSEDPESYSQAEIVRLLKGLDRSVTELRGEVHQLGATFVTRAELDAWRTSYDREIKDVKADVAEAKAAATPVKVSGWNIASFGVAALVGAGSLAALIISLITNLN